MAATRDRATRLRALLASLAAQRRVSFEVVVVDDGSGDETPQALRSAPGALELRTIRLERPRGPAAARNAGWRSARSELVAFIDDDCVAEPGWLAALLEVHRAEPRAFVQGPTEPDPRESARLGAFTRSQRIERLGPHYQACNIAYPRALLERLGGFDEAFRHFGEDTDLAWRALETGAPARWAPDARVLHAVHDVGAVATLRGSQRWADSVRLVKRHPGLRRHYHRRLFWKPSHERLLVALAASVLARRSRGTSLVLWVPYVRLHRRQHGSVSGTLLALPAHLAVDAAELVAMLRGSARFRTLVL